MEADGEEEAEQEVGDGLGSHEIPNGGDEYRFGDPIEGNPFIEGFDLAQAGDTEYLEEWVEQEPDDLADEVVIDQLCFPAVRKVGVEFMNALEGVMFNMIAFEGDGAWEELRKVGEDTGQAIGRAAFEKKMVSAFMDHDEKRMIGKGAQQVGCADNDPPGVIFHEPGQYYLEQYQAKDCKECILVLSDKLSHFRVLLQDLFRTKPVGLLISGINKIGSL